jgi:hypothetical protein
MLVPGQFIPLNSSSEPQFVPRSPAHNTGYPKLAQCLQQPLQLVVNFLRLGDGLGHFFPQ